MAAEQRSFLLTERPWTDIKEYLASDLRLIVPVGACDQYGPHLPIGAGTAIVESFARDLSAHCSVLCAPTIPYGVNVPARRAFPGSASLRVKTLHSLMNDLLVSWEDCGFREFILLTVHDYDSHVEAIATATVAGARVRMIELLNLDLSTVIADAPPAQHGGEIVTSLMLHLHPSVVRMDEAADYSLDEEYYSPLRRLVAIPRDSQGSVGRPTLATAETGRQLYEHIFQKIVTRVMTKTADEE